MTKNPPKFAPPDVTAIQTHVASHAEVVGPLYVEILDPKAGYKLQDDSDLALAADMVKEVKKLHKDINAEREVFAKPLHAMQVWVNGLYQPLLSNLVGKEARLKVMIGEYTRAQQEAQRLLLAQAAQKASNTKTIQQAQVIMDQALQVAQAAPAAKVQGVSVTETWDFQIEDDSAVPREYLCVDVISVKAAIKAGVREIPGIKIFSKAAVRVTT